IGKWIQKAYEEAQKGATVVCLLPSRTDTAWWHEYVMRAAEVRFIRGRLRFGGAENGAPFPSCVVVFRPGYSGPPVVKSMAAR
uniref:DNA N-6-adenine-methyltransferase n=1 Tax=Desulfovirgula thermocuniculi TaxID=348842 RepID=UPI00054D5781